MPRPDDRGHAGDLTEAIDAELTTAGPVDWRRVAQLAGELRDTASAAADPPKP